MWAHQVKKGAYVGTLSENSCFDGFRQYCKNNGGLMPPLGGLAPSAKSACGRLIVVASSTD